MYKNIGKRRSHAYAMKGEAAARKIQGAWKKSKASRELAVAR